MTVSIFDHELPNDTHNLYDITFFNTEIRTIVTHTPYYVDMWISNIQRIHQSRLHHLIVVLDVEWRPNFKCNQDNRIATLQLCVVRQCLIFQILHAPFIPPSLENFLGNSGYTFVGLGIERDVEEFLKDYGLSVANAIDLRLVAAEKYGTRELKNADSGYNDGLPTRYPSQSQYANSSSRAQFNSTSFALHDQQINNSHQTQSTRYDNRVGLALGPPQSSSSFQPLNASVQHSGLNPFEDWSQNRDKGVEDFLSEEEIRIKSHEMLENEDMQHLLRLFSMGGHSSVNGPEEGYAFPSYMPSPLPNFSFDEDRNRSGKAVVGWLKIKAAMRWGFFIRKKAAERRAQIVELEDD